MKLHNQHIITALNHECDKRIKELDADSPHGDYIFYSFQDDINLEKEDQEFFVVDWGKRIPLIARQSGFFAYILKAVT